MSDEGPSFWFRRYVALLPARPGQPGGEGRLLSPHQSRFKARFRWTIEDERLRILFFFSGFDLTPDKGGLGLSGDYWTIDDTDLSKLTEYIQARSLSG